MRLADLDAYFVGNWRREGHTRLASVEGAQGVAFQCPKCAEGKPRALDGGVRGAHYIICWFLNPRNAPQVPKDASPKPGRWTFSGDTIDTLSFTGPGAASVLLLAGCGWHGFVKNGEAA
jgi:hypothetical protein